MNCWSSRVLVIRRLVPFVPRYILRWAGGLQGLPDSNRSQQTQLAVPWPWHHGNVDKLEICTGLFQLSWVTFQAYIPRCWWWLRLRFLLLLLYFSYFCTSYYLMASPTIEIGFCSQLASCLVSNGGRQQSHDWSVLRTAAHVFKNKCKLFCRGWRTSDLDERNSWSYTLFTSRCLSYLVTVWCNGTPSSANPSTIISKEDKGETSKVGSTICLCMCLVLCTWALPIFCKTSTHQCNFTKCKNIQVQT